ncbi:hypothetical protein FXE84_02210 [Vibrio cholerae]|uniref:hypothetical protein n=1 Tax=Vibrio cholerae TaxID=666 RepID=UPI0004E30BDA|nr:hypothetical protein [Vibrio cholerae]KFE28727.1 hypothetical protein DN30_505 [Vibrio cholerae]TXY44182.1 hypothetical protein FXE84_02210 [Vibrio cholerae]
MNLKYLAILMVSFFAIAEDELKIENPRESISNYYTVTISIKNDGIVLESIVNQILPDSKVVFASTEQYAYIKEKIIVRKWYHQLFGIEPDPTFNHDNFKTGLEGSINLKEISKNEVFVEVQSSFAELVKIETFGDVAYPNLKLRNHDYKGSLILEQNNGCLQDNVDIDICITKNSIHSSS